MYNSLPGGTKVIVQGLECYLPPPGTVYNHLTRRLERRAVLQ